MAVALNVDRVVVRVHVARAVANGVQALDGLTLGVDNLEVVGNRDAADNGEQARGNLGRVEGALLDGEQEVRFLEEVSVFALLANLVVALDGLLGLVNVDVELLEQFVDGVGDLVVVGVFSTPSFTVLAWEADASAAVVPTARNESQNMPPPNSSDAVLSASKLESKIDQQWSSPPLTIVPTHLPLNPGGLVHEALALGVHEQEGPWYIAAACGCIIVGHGPSWKVPPTHAAMLWPSPVLPWSEHRRVITLFAMGANSLMYSSL